MIGDQTVSATVTFIPLYRLALCGVGSVCLLRPCCVIRAGDRLVLSAWSIITRDHQALCLFAACAVFYLHIYILFVADVALYTLLACFRFYFCSCSPPPR